MSRKRTEVIVVFEKDAVSPMQAVGQTAAPLYKWILSRLGKGMQYSGKKIPTWGGADKAWQGGRKVERYADGLGKTLEGGAAGNAEALNRLGRIGGVTTAAVGIPAALGVAGAIGSHRRKKDEAKIQELVDQLSGLKLAAHQAAFEEGFLAHCAELQLDSKGVADLLEKGASRTDGVGSNCKQFIDRLVATL